MTKILNHINTYQSETDYQNDNSKNFPNVSYIEEDEIVMFDNKVIYEEEYFAIESLEDDNAVVFKLSATSGTPSASSAKTISVSTDDGETWTDYTSTANGTTIATLNMGEKVLIKGNNNAYYTSGGFSGGYNHFTASKQIDVNGNIMSLIYGDNFKEQYSFPSGTTYNFSNFFISAPVVSAENLILPATTLANYCYSNMFNRCTSLVTAPELPAATLASGCYNAMFFKTNIIPEFPNIDFTSQINVNGEFTGLFAGTNITDADLERILPKNANGKYCLPATTLANNCYTYMFQGCTRLVNAPALPATTLAYGCYGHMFQGCTSLVNAPQLPATTLAYGCYGHMFQGCTSLVNAPELPATTLDDYCYINMFQSCTSLVNAPQLPATTLASGCYREMFSDCNSLVTAPQLSATTLTENCYESMFKDCTSLVNAPQLPATSLTSGCYQNMFYHCTSLTTAPTLPARYLKDNSYSFMFQACTNLNYIKAMFTTTPNTSNANYWVSGVAANGTFVKNRTATWNVTGVNGVPSGWTVQNASS